MQTTTAEAQIPSSGAIATQTETQTQTEIQSRVDTEVQTAVDPDSRGLTSAQNSSSNPDHDFICRHCHRSQSQAPSMVGGDTVPATPIIEPIQLQPVPPATFHGFVGSLGLSTVSVPNISHSPRLDPRSPISRTTSLPAK